MLLRHELTVRLAAVEQTLAGQPTRPDGDPRLVDVVADALRVQRRIGERREPRELVVLEHAELDHGDANGDRRHAEPTNQPNATPETARTPTTIAANTITVPKSG